MPGLTTPLAGVAEPQKAYGATSVVRRNRGRKGKQVPKGLPAKSVTTKSVDGVTTTVKTTPKSAFGMAEPPGGWYGPFGFLRMVSYMFMFWSAIMLTTFMYGLTVQDNVWSLAFCLVLCFASLLASAAAYSHEGLANQVTRMAKHNAEYAALNDDFTRQTNDLESVTGRIQEVLQGKAEKLEEFKGQMKLLDQLSSLNQISTVTRSFIDAQMMQYAREGGGDPDGILTHSEVRDFLLSAKGTLKERIPDFDLGDMARMAFFPGISLTEINLLLATVDTDFQEEKDCFLQLLHFFLSPHEQDLEDLKDLLAEHLKDNETFGKEGAVDAEIDRLLALVPKEGRYVEYGGEQRHAHCRVPVPETKKLLSEVLLTFMKDDENDLGVSDDEEE